MKRNMHIPYIAAAPSLGVSLVPVLTLIGVLVAVMAVSGPLAAADYAPWALLIASAAGVAVAFISGSLGRKQMRLGLLRSASQLLPAIPLLAFIAILSTTWMTSGVVPLFIEYGLRLINPDWFLVTVCGVCGIVSVVTGSSWSTIATVGGALAGIGDALGIHAGWTAGAVISGAYFGDKLSPLSDTTVVASSACGVDLFKHIRHMLPTTVPAMAIALVLFAVKGLTSDWSAHADSDTGRYLASLFSLSPWLLAIPLGTILMLAFRVRTVTALAVSSLAGVLTTLFVQPQLGIDLAGMPSLLWSGFEATTGNAAMDELVATGGLWGITPVVWLILCALVFGWVMIGTGMLRSITRSISGRLSGRKSVVGASLATGFTLNAATADQYLSIIISANMFRPLYRRMRLEPRLLSRTLEDAISATSPLIPWSSCGVTQAAVLGVATMTYLPYCFFNYLTPLFALLLAMWPRRNRGI